MNYRLLGRKTGLPVSEFALGTAVFGQTWGYGADAATAERIINIYAEQGGNLIDTADEYQLGTSEEIVGKAIATKRNDLILSSKYSRGASQGLGLGSLGNHRKNMVQAVEASLKRLATDRIDLYFVHMDDQFTPMEEIVRGLDDLVRSGKILYGGISNSPAWRIAAGTTLADARGWAGISAIQVEYSLLQRTTERELLPMADALGLGVLAYSPLGGGLLTGKYRKGEEGRATALKGSIPYEGTECADAILDQLFKVADQRGLSPSHVALAWLKAKGVTPLLGPRTVEQLADNLKAIDVELTVSEVAQLDQVSAIAPGYPHELTLAEQQRQVLTGGNCTRYEHRSLRWVDQAIEENAIFS